MNAAFFRLLDERVRTQLRRLARPLRGVATRVIGDRMALNMQVSGRDGESLSDVEAFQHYGFASVPAAGIEVVAVPVGGSTAHLVVVGEADRGTRPTDLEEGETVLYASSGAQVRLKPSGDIEITQGAGGKIFLAGGGADVARVGDGVTLDLVLAAWLDSVNDGLNSLGVELDFPEVLGGTITSGSSLVESG